MPEDQRRPASPGSATPASASPFAGSAPERKPNVLNYVRAEIRTLAGYTTGEQQPGCIKLNTNECAYDPSPRVWEALAGITPESLRLYPDPHSGHLREIAARRFSVKPEQIVAGNGSDDCLTILCRTFLAAGDAMACPWPSYGLYSTLAGIQGVNIEHVDYQRSATHWNLPPSLAKTSARLTVLANPNNPSSTLTPVAELRRLAERLDGILVVDEAYVDFALGTDPGASILPHLDAHPNLVVLRTFSKSYSLAGARLGLMFAAAPLCAEMNKVRDSYNVNVITQVLGAVALEDHAHHADVISRTLRERARLEREFGSLGWTWPEAHGNFLLCEIGPRARDVFEALRAQKILVRYWDTPELRTSIRITVGAPEQNDALMAALRRLI